MKALIIIDVQNDFLTNGSMQVPKTELLVSKINNYINNLDRSKWIIIATKDYHSPNHCSFANSGGLWPQHCVRRTNGSKIAIDLSKVNYIIKKATNRKFDSYSGFYNGLEKQTKLNKILIKNEVKDIELCGIAFDYCVFETAKDAIKLGYKVNVIKNLTASINESDDQKTIQKYLDKKINVVI